MIDHGKTTSTRRPRIGLLFDSLWDDFEATIWHGVLDEARAQDINLLCFAGGSIQSPYSNHANRTVLHDLIHRDNIDGLLAISGCIGAFVSSAELRQYLTRFADLPLISVSVTFNDLPSIAVDNRSGMYDLVSHFIKVHERKRIAFITGPDTNFDANERLAAYKQALSDHGIGLDAQLIVTGNFSHESGGRAVVALKEANIPFDAVVAANDYMALDAMRVLRGLGIHTPEHVLIGGFDDVKDSRSTLPSLTTVRQPTYELGRRAVRDMLRWLTTGTPSDTIKLPTRLVIRGSCGCLHAEHKPRHERGSASHAAKPATLEQTVSSVWNALNREFATITDILGTDSWARRLVDSYVNDAQGDQNAFRRTLESIVLEAANKPIEPGVWNDVLHRAFGLLGPYFPADNAARDAAFLFVNQYVAMRQASLWVEYERQTEILQRFQQPLSASFDTAQFGAIIENTLPRLHVDTFWLSLYESSDTNTQGLAYPLLQFEAQDANHHSVRVFDKEGAVAFPARELIPGKLRDGSRAYQVNIFPLSFEQEHFGFALFDINNQNANILEILNSQMTALIKGFRLIEEARHYTDKLENDVTARTTELRRANDLLVNKNVEIEKLNQELVQKNKVDVLTDLYNRGALFELIKMELNRTRRNRQRVQGKLPGTSPSADYLTFSIMMCDLDHFKHINDTYGHLVGDQVLRYIGELLKEAHVLRQEDVAGRFGGEEFIVVLTNTDAENALYPARRFVEQLKKKVFRGKDGQEFSVTTSVGISQFHDDDKSEEAVIQRADQALYYAKNHGRDQIVVFEKISQPE